MTTHPEFNAVFAAIAQVQTALTGKFVTTDTVVTNKYSYKYVPLPELLAIVTPLLNENKLVAVTTIACFEGQNVMTVQLVHIETNDYLSSDWHLGAPGVLQADGGKLTYYSRRLLMGLLGIHPEDDETEQVNVAAAPAFMPPMGMPPVGAPPAFMPPPVNAAPQLPPGWTPPGVPAAAPAVAAPVQLPPGWTPPAVPAAPVVPPAPGGVPQFKFAKPQ